ncbi:MAG: patatin-like phospholipase family protein [Bacteroidales bacterium]|nr:patatin-like phospholipase family protein [Bacteroidales bacterium]
MGKKVALALSGGGARGIAHIGVIEELERRGYEITSVAGTSMGALVGGVYVAGELSIFKDWISIMDKYMFFSLMDINFKGDGILKGEKVLKELQQLVPDIKIEDCKIPFAATATNLITREEVVFDKGSLYDGIRASISLPLLFQPYRLGDMLLADGGIVNQLPINRVKRTEGDILVAVDVGANIQSNIQNKKDVPRFSKDERNIVMVLTESASIMTQRIAEMSIQLYKPDIVIRTSVSDYNVLDFDEAEDIIKAGVKATCLALD